MPNMLDLMTKTADGNFAPKLDKGFVGLFIGEPGSGKDTAVASMPKPLFVLDIDHRVSGMRNATEWLGIDEMKKIEYEQFTLKDTFTKIAGKLESILNEAQRGNKQYNTIYIASITSFGQLLAMESRKDRGVKETDPGDFLDAKYAGRLIRGMFYKLIMPLQELGINVIFAAHIVSKWGKGNPNEKGMVTPEIIGEKMLGVSDAFAEEIMGFFDNVIRFNKKESAVGAVSFEAVFEGNLSRTVYPIKVKKIDVTGKSFYALFKTLLDGAVYKIAVNGGVK